MPLEYFTEAELRALPDMDSEAIYTDARIQSAHDYIVGILEREVGTSFVARTVTAEVHDGGAGATYALNLEKPFVLSLTSATEDGSAVTETLTKGGAGLAYKFASGATTPTAWAPGVRNITITYSAGYSSVVPGDVKEAVLKGVRLHLLATDSNAAEGGNWQTQTQEGATITRAPHAPTGYPEVDSVIVAWAEDLDGFGFA